jgi:hypothetical protein
VYKASEREGKLSNPRGRAARAMHGENLRKFTETRAAEPRARRAVISCHPEVQYRSTDVKRDQQRSRRGVCAHTCIY